MKSWSITEATANIADVFDAALKDPQKIERRESEAVVIVAESAWNKLLAEYPTFADLVLNADLEDEDLPRRQPARVLGRKSRR